MTTSFHLLILTLSSLFHLCQPQKPISLASKTSKNNYLYVPVTWGSPSQSFNVLVDTTDHTSWVYNQSVITKQPKFNPGKSSTFKPNGTKTKFIYQMQSTTIDFANDTLTLNNNYAINTTFATAIQNFSITDTEAISGFLCLDRLSKIVPALYNKQYIQNKSISIDVGNNKLYFGQYIPSESNINNVSNISLLSNTTNPELNKIWAFDIQVYINNVPSLGGSKFRGVIDSASPYIRIFAKSEQDLFLFWQLIDGSKSQKELNCNYTTRICSNINNMIMQWMTIVIKDVAWNISFYKEDIIVDKNIIQFLYDNDTDFTSDSDYVLFLGRPFLDKVLTTMNLDDETIVFYSLKESTTTLNWITIAIVFVSVLAFALIFFGIYYWKFGKIPAASTNDVEEQVSLLRGPVQAVGSSQGQGNVQGQSSGWSNISGLDEDNDEERQIQQAQRLSAIEAQQEREKQMREDQIRNEQIQLDEQKQQAQLQKEENKKQQKIGGGQKPQDANELRQRRLKFLEDQQKKAQQQDNDEQ